MGHLEIGPLHNKPEKGVSETLMEVERILAIYPGDCSFNADATKRKDTVLIGIENHSFTVWHKGISSVCEMDHKFSVI